MNMEIHMKYLSQDYWSRRNRKP